MAPESKIKKIILWTVVVVFVVFLIWFLFFKNTEEPISMDEYGNPIQAESVGQDLVDLLSELQSVKLDQSIFQSPGFTSLTDFSTILPDLPRGKKNPFSKL